MSQITPAQIQVLGALREAQRGHHAGDEVPVAAIRERAQDQGLSYDATNRGLTALVKAGIATRPSRGRYVLSDATTYTLDGVNWYPVPA